MSLFAVFLLGYVWGVWGAQTMLNSPPPPGVSKTKAALLWPKYYWYWLKKPFM